MSVGQIRERQVCMNRRGNFTDERALKGLTIKNLSVN